MTWLTRWHLLERFWEPVRRQLFLARQLRTERDYWKRRAEAAEQALPSHSSYLGSRLGPPYLALARPGHHRQGYRAFAVQARGRTAAARRTGSAAAYRGAAPG